MIVCREVYIDECIATAFVTSHVTIEKLKSSWLLDPVSCQVDLRLYDTVVIVTWPYDVKLIINSNIQSFWLGSSISSSPWVSWFPENISWKQNKMHEECVQQKSKFFRGSTNFKLISPKSKRWNEVYRQHYCLRYPYRYKATSQKHLKTTYIEFKAFHLINRNFTVLFTWDHIFMSRYVWYSSQYLKESKHYFTMSTIRCK